MKKTQWIPLLALVLTLAMPTFAMGEANFGAAALSGKSEYTLEEMLTYAIQDEYLAQAEYKTIMEAYGEQRPFTNIMQAEGQHISRLLPLFTAHNIKVPEDTALDHVVKPESLQAAYEAGVTAEVHNIAMYQAFLAQKDLPDDVRQVFESLMRASQNHLRAFEQKAGKTTGGYSNNNGNRDTNNNGKNNNNNGRRNTNRNSNRNTNRTTNTCNGCQGCRNK